MKICIDAGHGGTDSGAAGTQPFRLEEKDFNLKLAVFLEEELESRGHWVAMTRRRDRTLRLSDRADFANRLGADFFVSIHANAFEDPGPEGMEVFHFPGSSTGRSAANLVLSSMTENFPDHTNRGVKEKNLAVLRLTRMTAILIECEFISNPIQLQFLADPQNQQDLAVAIAEGIDAIS
jgi:N-acetylmuramoyl-L-alanine amidase